MELFPLLYGKLIDPLLSGIRKINSACIPEDSDVIDIACGTGDQAFILARKCRRVEGTDISVSMVRYAERRRKKSGMTNLFFSVHDAADLSAYPDKMFDYSILILAMHQFPADSISQILREASRISGEIIISDYAVPLPGNIFSLIIRLAERMAGRMHHRCFKYYLEAGGMVTFCGDAGLILKSRKTFGHGVFEPGRFAKILPVSWKPDSSQDF
jgi:demethylmenaquinone methyltransferase/2-methoxy-6-polyprenyl-1,4-benzoquinol methylase